MVKIINSDDIVDDNVDMVCTHCGREFNINEPYKEGIDYVFEKDGSDIWCICNDCRKELDGI